MSFDLDKVKSRIRKLLNLAADDAQADGEISAAMKLAEQAMVKYQLELADIEADDTQETPAESIDRVFAKCRTSRLTQWESKLASAIVELVGSIKWYQAMQQVQTGAFQKTRQSVVCFYGPAEDVRIASELFAEFIDVIATMACGKFGGCIKGQGATYAYGFASALKEKAYAASQERARIITPSTTAIVKRSEGSLADVLVAKKERASQWLAESGIKLSNTSSSRGYNWNSNTRSAYDCGKQDGSRSDFSANRMKKLN